MSQLSRNRRAGELLAANHDLGRCRRPAGRRGRGETTVTGALALAGRHGVEMPIAEQVDAVIHRGRGPLEALATLMARTQKDELTSPGAPPPVDAGPQLRAGRPRWYGTSMTTVFGRQEQAQFQAKRSLIVERVLPQVPRHELGEDHGRRT